MRTGTLLLCACVAMTLTASEAQRPRPGGPRPRPRPTRPPRPTPAPGTPAPTTPAPTTGEPVDTPVPVTPTPTTPQPTPVPTTPQPTPVPTPVPTTPVPTTPAPTFNFGNALTRPGQLIQASVRQQYLPVVESIVRVMEERPGSFRPLLVRLAWHSAAQFNAALAPTGGTNGGCIRTAPELGLPDNKGVDVAVNALEAVKAAHPFVTYADLYQLAGNTALEYMGSPRLPFRPGRVDYASPATQCVSDAHRLPIKHVNNDGFRHPDTLAYFFTKFEELGFSLSTDPEALWKAVALMGGHNMGAMHADISRNSGVWTANNLVFGNEYFRNLFNGPWGPNTARGPNADIDLQYFGGPRPGFVMLPIDMVLREDPRLVAIGRAFENDLALFSRYFVQAWQQLQENGVVFPPTA